MTTSEQMFLYVAEEMSFTRAAEKCFVSQQAMSNHVRKLEEELNTKLFVRSPRLMLTDPGKVLYDSLQKIRRIEQHARESIEDSSNMIRGRIALGMQADRAHMLFPVLYPQYHAMYPNVTLSLVSGHTNDFLVLLERGDIDLMVAHDMEARRDLLRETVFEEAIYLVGSERFLRSHLPDYDSRRDWLEPAEIPLLPLSCTSFGCAVMDHVNRFLAREHVQGRYICEVGDYVTQLMLCEAGETAFFCPESFMTQRDFTEASHRKGEDRVMAVPVRGLDSRVHVELISRAEDYIPRYMEDFRKLLLQEYKDRIYALQGWCPVPQGQ